MLDKLHVLLAIALELPEDYFVNIHKYEVKSEDHLRYMKYSKYTPEENLKIGKQWVGGHTGMFVSFQPALQCTSLSVCLVRSRIVDTALPSASRCAPNQEPCDG